MVFGIGCWLVIVGVYHTYKSVPDTVGMAAPEHTVAAESVTFLADRTYLDTAGERQTDHVIFDEILTMIDEAEEYLLIDMFLFNDFLGAATTSTRPLSSELTSALVAKASSSDATIQVITDPVNTIYGGMRSPQLAALEAAGVEVTLTDLRPLRDSNPAYSVFWRTFFQWFGVGESGWLPNPMDVDAPQLSARAYLALLNYKANHRKLIVADFTRDGERGLATLITSLNPHDGSSAHSNVAVRVDERIWQDVIRSESEVAWWSGSEFARPSETLRRDAYRSDAGTLTVQLLTEYAIEAALLSAIDSAEAEDRIDLAMFYLADRDIVRALKAADERGVTIRLLLDPNKDAFGREKIGLPNRQVAHELMRHTEGNTRVRWCATHGEQCHSKLFLLTSDGRFELIQGSANLTRRNLENYNLETNVRVVGSSSEPFYQAVDTTFTDWWQNTDARTYSTDYSAYADDSQFRTLRYRFKEATGMSRW